MKKVVKYLVPTLLGVFAVVLAASAQLAPPPSAGTGLVSTDSLFIIVMEVVNYILYFVGAVALLFLIYGGFSYIISGGSEDRIEKAKQIITYAIVGLLIVVVSWVIVNEVIMNIFA